MSIRWILILLPSLAFGQVVRPPATSPTAPVTLGQLQTTAPINLYVETTGNDTNSCTSALTPCLTIQAAANKIPKRILHPITINVGAGSFGGAVFTGLNFEHPASTALPPAGGSYLYIKGTLAAPTLTTGTTTGTATSGTAGSLSTATFGTLTDTSQTWTANELVGLLVERTGGTGSTTSQVPNRYPIVSNTSDTITIAGTWTAPNATSTYAIRDWATTINPDVPFQQSALSTGTSSIKSGIVFTNNQLPVASNIVIAGFKFVLDAISEYAFYGIGTQATMLRNNKVVAPGAVTGRVGFASTGSPLDISRNSFVGEVSSSGGNAVSVSANEGSVSIFGNYFYGFYIQMSVGPVSVAASTFGNQFSSPYYRAAYFASSRSSAVTSISGSRFDGTGTTNACIHVTTYLTISGVDVSNCPWGLFIQTWTPLVVTGDLTGTGNGFGIQLLNGANAWIYSGPTISISGTTADIDLDGTYMTWAQFNSLSPSRAMSDKGSTIFK